MVNYDEIAKQFWVAFVTGTILAARVNAVLEDSESPKLNWYFPCNVYCKQDCIPITLVHELGPTIFELAAPPVLQRSFC